MHDIRHGTSQQSETAYVQDRDASAWRCHSLDFSLFFFFTKATTPSAGRGQYIETLFYSRKIVESVFDELLFCMVSFKASQYGFVS